MVAPISATGAAVPVVVGVISGDRPTVVQFAGLIITVAGVVLASGPELTSGLDLRPVFLALMSGSSYGVSLVLVAHGSKFSPAMTLVGMRAVNVVDGVILVVWTTAGHGLDRAALPWIVAVGVGDKGGLQGISPRKFTRSPRSPTRRGNPLPDLVKREWDTGELDGVWTSDIERHEALSNRVGVGDLHVGPSQRPGRSWEQPDPGDAGEVGSTLRQRRAGPALPDGPGSASEMERRT